MNQHQPLTQLSAKIISASCTYYAITEDQLREKQYTEQRKIVCYLLRNNAMWKYMRIARHFGYKDHNWLIRMVAEIDSQKDIYTHISHDIKNILQIVGTLA